MINLSDALRVSHRQNQATRDPSGQSAAAELLRRYLLQQEQERNERARSQQLEMIKALILKKKIEQEQQDQQILAFLQAAQASTAVPQEPSRIDHKLAQLLSQLQTQVPKEAPSAQRQEPDQKLVIPQHASALEWNARFLASFAPKHAHAASPQAKCTTPKHERFPVTLYRMIEETKARGREDIISFAPSGAAFVIHSAEAFELQILPLYFDHGKLTSFKRQLNLYGFRMIIHGVDSGAYANPVFHRDNRKASEGIRRTK